MNKIFNIFLTSLIIIFILSISNYYVSNKNIDIKDYNRSNIDQILKEKISNLPILINDTNNVIEFNDLFEDGKDDKKKRSFWDLLKTE
tara:strand:+ start:270 stop:533 length:264 start_codon:yes stop_codon:yes gene_type:complete